MLAYIHGILLMLAYIHGILLVLAYIHGIRVIVQELAETSCARNARPAPAGAATAGLAKKRLTNTTAGTRIPRAVLPRCPLPAPAPGRVPPADPPVRMITYRNDL